MGQIPVSEVRTGATLAEPVVDHRGRVLLRAGCTLTSAIITCLERWAIDTVTLRDGDSPPGSTPPPQREPQPLAELWEELFRDPLSNEMQLVRRALSSWLAQRQGIPTKEQA